jgi:large subunit ribosomal protein L22
MKAILKNYRQSPRKVRLVADAISGITVENAIMKLSFMPKRSALPIQLLIQSAKANAEKNFGMNPDDLIVKQVLVNKGVVLKRMRPRARGSAYRINKRTSILTVLLGTKADLKQKKGKKGAQKEVVENTEKTVSSEVSKPKSAPKKKAVTKAKAKS